MTTERIRYSPVKTNWYVITGGPGSGKTTTVNLLAKEGYRVTIEHGRHYIDTQLVTGKTVQEIKSNHKEFQLGVLNMQIDQEGELSPNEIVFLDRAIPDALAYYRFLSLAEDELILNALHLYIYKKVFILDLLPLVHDYARTEDSSEQSRIHQLITEVYASLPSPIVKVPVLTPEGRIKFILNNL